MVYIMKRCYWCNYDWSMFHNFVFLFSFIISILLFRSFLRMAVVIISIGWCIQHWSRQCIPILVLNILRKITFSTTTQSRIKKMSFEDKRNLFLFLTILEVVRVHQQQKILEYDIRNQYIFSQLPVF